MEARRKLSVRSSKNDVMTDLSNKWRGILVFAPTPFTKSNNSPMAEGNAKSRSASQAFERPYLPNVRRSHSPLQYFGTDSEHAVLDVAESLLEKFGSLVEQVHNFTILRKLFFLALAEFFDSNKLRFPKVVSTVEVAAGEGHLTSLGVDDAHLADAVTGGLLRDHGARTKRCTARHGGCAGGTGLEVRRLHSQAVGGTRSPRPDTRFPPIPAMLPENRANAQQTSLRTTEHESANNLPPQTATAHTHTHLYFLFLGEPNELVRGTPQSTWGRRSAAA